MVTFCYCFYLSMDLQQSNFLIQIHLELMLLMNAHDINWKKNNCSYTKYSSIETRITAFFIEKQPGLHH